MKKKTFLTSVTVLAASLALEAGAAVPEALMHSLEPVAALPPQSAPENSDQAAPFVLRHSEASENVFLAAHRSHSSHSSHSSHYSGYSGGGSYSPPAPAPNYQPPSYQTPSDTPSQRDSSPSSGTGLSPAGHGTAPSLPQYQTEGPKSGRTVPSSAEDTLNGPTSLDSFDKNLIIQVQVELYRAGFGPAKFDGILGPSTKRALTEFQASRNLSATGQLSVETLDALGIKQ
jgi:His-Xaa-Ser repeat protein HxsA